MYTTLKLIITVYQGDQRKGLENMALTKYKTTSLKTAMPMHTGVQKFNMQIKMPQVDKFAVSLTAEATI